MTGDRASQRAGDRASRRTGDRASQQNGDRASPRAEDRTSPRRTAIGRPLLWNVTGLLGEDAGATRDYRVAGVTIDLGEDLRLAEPIEGQVRLARTNRGLLVKANLTTALEALCSRCLRELELPITIELEEEALPSVDLHSGVPIKRRDPDDDEILRLTDHHELDLEQTVREAIILAEPIAPLCRVDCPGLCLVCGERLDEGIHDHPDVEIDPRLEVLRAFKPE